MEIFLKPEELRTPQEQAYVLAMQQYHSELQKHIGKHPGVPEYSLASGTVIFAKSESQRTPSEADYVKDMMEEFFSALQHDLQQHTDEESQLNMEIQNMIMSRASEIFAKSESERSKDEQAYVLKIQECARDLKKFEVKHGVQVSHDLATAVLTFPKAYDNDLQEHDVELLYDVGMWEQIA